MFVTIHDMLNSKRRVFMYTVSTSSHIAFIALSDKKWVKGNQYKKAPIWIDRLRDVPTVFLWNIAIGAGKRKGGRQR